MCEEELQELCPKLYQLRPQVKCDVFEVTTIGVNPQTPHAPVNALSAPYIYTEILDCINAIYESNLNEEENLFLLNIYLCM